MEYESGATASFVMSVFNEGGRRIRIMGTKGELEAQMGQDSVSVFNFVTRKRETYSVQDFVADESIVGGHGGGDTGIIRAFCQLMRGVYQGSSIADISESVDNHLTTFAAEASRLTGTVIDLDEYRKEYV
jgi:predicted dehydrogenase